MKKGVLEKAAKNYRETTANQMYGDELGFIAGAKWQAEKDLELHEAEKDNKVFEKLIKTHEHIKSMMYTKEEVLEQLNLLYAMKNSTVDLYTDEEDFITLKWFEHFKK